MKYLPGNTLAHFNDAPQTQRLDLSAIPTSVFSASTLEYRKTCGEVFPNDEAITFYALNHCASVIRRKFTPNEILPDWALNVMATYTQVTAAQGTRLLHYILSITTREMRHLKPTHAATFWKTLEQKAGPEMVEFIKLVHSNGNEDTAVKAYMHKPPNATVGQYLEAMSYGFWKGWGNFEPETWQQHWSGSYGGPMWALVADAALAMAKGQTSMEMLVDTGYTLAHNGGPIFNKGMMYKHYDAEFIKILDIQRSGQIPDLMLDTHAWGPKKTTEAQNAVQLVANALPGEFKGYVDWKPVIAMLPPKDSKHKYDALLGKQKVKTPAAPIKPVKVPDTFLFGKKVKQVGEFVVLPGVSVPTFERLKVA
jgi:hypothetical protein